MGRAVRSETAAITRNLDDHELFGGLKAREEEMISSVELPILYENRLNSQLA
jgi:hypothetical protein